METKTQPATGSAQPLTFKFFSDVDSDGIALKAHTGDGGEKIVTLTASTNTTDLVGDVMTQKALKQMEKSAVGQTMFLNHKQMVPEDVFGAVKEARLEKSGNITRLVYDVVVEESNPRAVKTWEIIEAKRCKLGASVTVAVREKSASSDGRRLIDDVYLLETSIVGIPCNQDSWVGYARKALELSEAGDVKTADAAAAGGAESKVIDPRAAFATEVKGLFADIMAERVPSMSDVVSVLYAVVYRIYRRNSAATGDEDKLDVAGTLAEALVEFAESFTRAATSYLDGSTYSYSLLDRLNTEAAVEVVTKGDPGSTPEILYQHTKALAEAGAADAAEVERLHAVVARSLSLPAATAADGLAIEASADVCALLGVEKAILADETAVNLASQLVTKSQESDAWKAGALVLLTALRKYSAQPSVRPGAVAASS
jgi:hypothetical protein